MRRSLKKGYVIKGKQCHYIIGEIKGRGGNGEVYSVKTEGSKPDCRYSNYVIKILNVDRFQFADKEKRIERFKREIETQTKYQNEIPGIMPICDSFIQKESTDCYWYLMPTAKKITHKLEISEALDKGIALAQIIKKLHENGLAHRDIKPDNLLVLNGKLKLSDFGLIWNMDYECITETDEHIGPLWIRPPELDCVKSYSENDAVFFASDIYMFAKTVWCIITGQSRGFPGPYNRSNPQVCLNDVLKPANICLEPLNVLMENATLNDPSKRIEIDECIDLLQKQKSIVDGTIPAKELNTLSFIQSTKESNCKIEEDVKVYNDVTKIVSILKKYVNISHILLDEYGVTTEIGKLQNVLSINNSNIELTVINEYKRRSVKFHCIVRQIEFLSDEECSLYTDISKDVPSGFNVIDTTRDLIQLIEDPNESNSLYSAESKFIVLPIE